MITVNIPCTECAHLEPVEVELRMGGEPTPEGQIAALVPEVLLVTPVIVDIEGAASRMRTHHVEAH